MAINQPDWPSDNDGAGEEVVAQAAPPAAPSSGAAPATATPAAPAVVVVEEEPLLPGDYKEARAMLAEYTRFARLSDKPTAEAVAGHRKYLALQKHVHALQQGLPHTELTAGNHVAFAGLGASQVKVTRWAMKARGDLDFKDLLAERDALLKKNEALSKENAELNELLK